MLTRTRTIITCTAAAAAVGLGAGLAAPALAAGRPAPGAAAGGAPRLTNDDHAAGQSAARAVNTRTFAGYQAGVRAGSATVLTASFTVPALSCTTANRAILPDAGIAVGSKGASVAFVVTACVNGSAVYFPGLVSTGTRPTSPRARSPPVT